jgi:hypothetical protein
MCYNLIEMIVLTANRKVTKSPSRNVAFWPKLVSPHIPIIPFLRWDEKAGLRRDAIRSQCSTCSRHKERETGYEKD